MAEETELGIAWYHEHQWDKLRNYSKDKTSMAQKYSDWLAKAEETAKDFERRGYTVHKNYIDVDMLIAWAKKKGLDIDGHTRSDYANHLAANRRGLTDDV